AVSGTRGAYVNELGGVQQSSTENNRAYLSTTKATPTTVRAELNVSKTQQSPEARVERSDAADTAQGGAGSGVSLTKGIVDPADGAFHHHNGDKPEASLITRYPAIAALSSLPLSNPYGGHLVVQNSGTAAKLNQPEPFDPTSYVQTHLVNGVGTYVNLPSLVV
ncbi:hypothetical protein, partial [Streptomyces sp. ADI96-02]|uniref:hypothetical protein n=2 Tax=unclassified Streptomyces TaxID=2593676 RepID=UPI0019CF531C